MKLILLFFSLLISDQPFSTANPEADTLDHYIQHRMEAENIPGLSISIIEPDGQIIHKNFGYADLKQQPVDKNTIFEIGSITKTFTAGLIHIFLDEQGNDPATTYYKDTDINVHHLLTHHSGLPRLPENLQPTNPADPYRNYTDSMMHDFMNNYQPEHEPGDQFTYSNLGYMLLGHLVETTSGKTYDDAIRFYITKELNMNSTSRSIIDSSRFAIPSAGGFEVSEWNFNGVKGLGGLRSTATDMVNYLKMMMGNTVYSFSDSFRETIQHRVSINDDVEIAHSWFINNSFDDEIILHDGHTGGSGAFVGFSIVSGKGVVILSNSNQNISDIGMHILNNDFSLKEVPEYVQLETDHLENLSGTYHSQVLPGFTIFRKGNQLYGQMEGQQALPLNAISKTEFENRSVQARIVFEITNNQTKRLTLRQGGQSYPFERKEE